MLACSFVTRTCLKTTRGLISGTFRPLTLEVLSPEKTIVLLFENYSNFEWLYLLACFHFFSVVINQMLLILAGNEDMNKKTLRCLNFRQTGSMTTVSFPWVSKKKNKKTLTNNGKIGFKKLKGFYYLGSKKQTQWSACALAQLIWVFGFLHMQKTGFFHDYAQLMLVLVSSPELKAHKVSL